MAYWVSPDPRDTLDTKMLSSVVMKASQINSFYSDDEFIQALVGSSTDNVCSIVYYPIDFSFDEFNPTTHEFIRKEDLYLNVGKLTRTVKAYKLSSEDRYYLFYIAKYYVSYGDYFYHYEPYCTCDIFLPFYGYVNIPMKDIAKKYIKVLLKVDYPTGQAIYIITAQEEDDERGEKTPSETRYYSQMNDNARIIATYAFTLGTPIPIGKSGTAELIRNTTMALIEGVATVASTYYMGAAGLGITTTTIAGTKTIRTRNPATNRMTHKAQIITDEVHTYDRTNILKQRAVSETVSSSMNVLNSFNYKPRTDCPSNANLMMNCTNQVRFTFRLAKFVDIGDEYDFRHLNGVPLGRVVKLDNLSGYTEITSIHVEGSDFNSATREELDLLENVLKSGIIL